MNQQHSSTAQKLDEADEARLDGVAEMDKLRLRMIGRQDRDGADYYMTTTAVPCLVDLSKTVIHVFPDESENGEEFWAELVIRKHGTSKDPQTPSGERRRRRRKRKPKVAREN